MIIALFNNNLISYDINNTFKESICIPCRTKKIQHSAHSFTFIIGAKICNFIPEYQACMQLFLLHKYLAFIPLLIFRLLMALQDAKISCIIFFLYF